MCALFRRGQPGWPGACLPKSAQGSLSPVIKREGKQQGVLFRCCPPKWGPQGTVWPRKLAKLMVVGASLNVWALEAEKGQGREPSRSTLIKGSKEKHSQSGDVEAPCHLTGQSGCPGDRAPAVRGQPLAKAEPPGSVSRPSFVQLMQAGPLLSPADREAGSQEVRGHSRAQGPWGLQRGSGCFPWQQSLWKAVSCICQCKVSHSEITGRSQALNWRLTGLAITGSGPIIKKKFAFLMKKKHFFP